MLYGAIIEGVATLLCRLTSKYLGDLEPRYAAAIDSFVATSLVVAAFDYSGGLIFHPPTHIFSSFSSAFSALLLFLEIFCSRSFFEMFRTFQATTIQFWPLASNLAAGDTLTLNTSLSIGLVPHWELWPPFLLTLL